MFASSSVPLPPCPSSLPRHSNLFMCAHVRIHLYLWCDAWWFCFPCWAAILSSRWHLADAKEYLKRPSGTRPAAGGRGEFSHLFAINFIWTSTKSIPRPGRLHIDTCCGCQYGGRRWWENVSDSSAIRAGRKTNEIRHPWQPQTKSRGAMGWWPCLCNVDAANFIWQSLSFVAGRHSCM